MEISGKIIWAGEKRGGVGAQSGKSWASQDFAIESRSTGPYGEVVTRVAFSVFGDDKLSLWNPCVGDEVTVGYGVNAHEYQGRWYNEVRAYKYERRGQAQPVQQSVYAGQQASQYNPGGQYTQQATSGGYRQPTCGSQPAY